MHTLYLPLWPIPLPTLPTRSRRSLPQSFSHSFLFAHGARTAPENAGSVHGRVALRGLTLPQFSRTLEALDRSVREREDVVGDSTRLLLVHVVRRIGHADDPSVLAVELIRVVGQLKSPGAFPS